MKYGLVGERLDYSYSKDIHETLTSYTYDYMEVARKDFRRFMKKKDFKAINVTIPYKKEVVKYLDESCDAVKAMGSCNTVVNKDGKLYGYNTDALGMEEALKHFGFDLEGKTVMILGTGGSAASAGYVSKLYKARKIIYVTRFLEKTTTNTILYEDMPKYYNSIDFLFNCTPVGTYPNNDQKPVDISKFRYIQGVMDLVYNPQRTALLMDCEKRGIKYANGLYMLIAQALFAIEKFLDKKINHKAIETIYQSISKQKLNVILIGMPGSGKSTIGRLLGSQMQREFYDMDDLIVDRIHMPIKDYFNMYGEPSFREIEREVAIEVGKNTGVVIATGGGTILDMNNLKALEQNGIMFFLDRDPENIDIDDSRPLTKSKEEVLRIYKERIGLYRKYANYTVDANKPFYDITSDICKIFLEMKAK